MKKIALLFSLLILLTGWTHYRDSSGVDADKGTVSQIDARGCDVRLFIVPTSSPSTGSNNVGTITAASESVSVIRFPVKSATAPGAAATSVYGVEDLSANKVGTTGYVFDAKAGYGFIGVSHDSTNLAGTGSKTLNMYYSLANCTGR